MLLVVGKDLRLVRPACTSLTMERRAAVNRKLHDDFVARVERAARNPGPGVKDRGGGFGVDSVFGAVTRIPRCALLPGYGIRLL